jgi:hypothetical protein
LNPHQDGQTQPSRRRFSISEDRLLEQLVRELGASSWEQVAARLPYRSERQCRERWKHHLSAGKLDIPWTPDEDRLIWEKVDEIGPKWTHIAALLAGRSDYQAKARWLQLFGKRRRNCFRDVYGPRKRPSRRRTESRSDGGKPKVESVIEIVWDSFDVRGTEDDVWMFLQW